MFSINKSPVLLLISKTKKNWKKNFVSPSLCDYCSNEVTNAGWVAYVIENNPIDFLITFILRDVIFRWNVVRKLVCNSDLKEILLEPDVFCIFFIFFDISYISDWPSFSIFLAKVLNTSFVYDRIATAWK